MLKIEVKTNEEVIQIEELLAGIKDSYMRKGGLLARKFIKETIQESKTPRDGSLGDEYWRGYDKAIADAINLLRDKFFNKNSKV